MKEAAKLLTEIQKGNLEVDTVHDTRVAFRRCLSMIDAYRELDESPVWDRLARIGKTTFKLLGSLRDAQVLLPWLSRLSPPADPIRKILEKELAAAEKKARSKVAEKASRFPSEEWFQGLEQVETRIRCLRSEGLVFQHIALQRHRDALALHRKALDRGKPRDYHDLRIAVKRFRYVLENFLPQIEVRHHSSLKKVQDLLGDAQDLDVLAKRVAKVAKGPDRRRWRKILSNARKDRIASYLRYTEERDVWNLWREPLPRGVRLEVAALATLGTWASFHFGDFSTSRTIARSSLRIFDALRCCGLEGPFARKRARRILCAASLVHAVGRSARDRGYHKISYRLTREHEPPIGWTSSDMLLTGLVARYHRGALPKTNHPGYRNLTSSRRRMVCSLGAVLRLAHALSSATDGTISKIEVRRERHCLLLAIGGIELKEARLADLSEAASPLASICKERIEIVSEPDDSHRWSPNPDESPNPTESPKPDESPKPPPSSGQPPSPSTPTQL